LERLLSLHAFPVCGPGLLAGRHPLREPEDLVHHRLLHEASTEWWKRWLTAAGVTGVDWGAGHIFHESTLALEAALAEEGVALGDNLLALRELEASRLVKPFRQTCPTGSYYLATLRDADASPDPTLALFREWLLARCAEQQLRCDRWR
jgi:LysR family glycine cleavage system transcriptional activator